MADVDSNFALIRDELLKGLYGTVLDVGCGDGMYMKYVFRQKDNISHYIALEPNRHMHPAINKTYKSLLG